MVSINSILLLYVSGALERNFISIGPLVREKRTILSAAYFLGAEFQAIFDVRLRSKSTPFGADNNAQRDFS